MNKINNYSPNFTALKYPTTNGGKKTISNLRGLFRDEMRDLRARQKGNKAKRGIKMNSISVNLNNNVNFQGKRPVNKNEFKKIQAKAQSLRQNKMAKFNIEFKNIIGQINVGNIATYEQAVLIIKNTAEKFGCKSLAAKIGNKL